MNKPDVMCFESGTKDITQRGSSLLVRSLISTRDYHGDDIDPLFEKYLNSWINKEIRWRHNDNEELYIGEVRGVDSDGNGNYYGNMEIFGDHAIQKSIQEEILRSIDEGNPIGVSTSFLVYREEKKPVTLYNREISITPAPKCDECRVIEVLNEAKIMPKNEEKNIWEETVKDNIRMMQSKVTTLENDNKTKDVLVEELDAKVKAIATEKADFEKRISELEAAAEKLTEENTQLKEEATFQSDAMPLITEMLTLQNITDDEARAKELEMLKTFDANQLKFMVDKAKATVDAKVIEDAKKDINTKGQPVAEGAVDKKESEMTPEEYAISLAKKGHYPLAGKHYS